MSGAAHPRYRGPVVDTHCHYDAGTRGRATAVAAMGGLRTAVHLWDLQWPPASFAAEASAWDSQQPALVRCHVPDLSAVGTPAFDEAVVRRAREADAAGAVGMKVWKNVGLWEVDADGERLRLDDPRLAPLWRVAAELRSPVVIHVGDPPAFFAPLDDDNPRIEELRVHPEWWWGAPGYPSLAELHGQLERVVAGHPDTVFVAAHFGSFLPWPEVGRMLDSYVNFHVDTAAAIADMGRDPGNGVREIVLAHPDRVLFGTDLIRTAAFDMPELDSRWDLERFFELHWRFFETGEELAHPLPAQGDWTVTGLDLPADVLEQLYVANAERLFKLG